MTSHNLYLDREKIETVDSPMVSLITPRQNTEASKEFVAAAMAEQLPPVSDVVHKGHYCLWCLLVLVCLNHGGVTIVSDQAA